MVLDTEKHETSEIHRSYFHLGPLQGILISFPVIPADTLSGGGVIPMIIEAIQVGAVTGVIPPGTVTQNGAVIGAPVIIILISSGKWITVMRRQRVTSSS